MIEAAPFAFCLLLAAATPVTAPKGPEARTLSAAERDELLAAREDVWRAWFAGDTVRLEAALPQEFLSMSFSPGPWKGRAEVVADAAAFKAGGGRLLTLAFPRTEVQAYGDVAILYTTYRAEFESGGERHTMAGRGTEVFVRRDGRWLHPGWHLDAVTEAPAGARPTQ